MIVLSLLVEVCFSSCRQFITGEFTDTSDAKAEMLNAICRKDCSSSSETYCYSTVLTTLVREVTGQHSLDKSIRALCNEVLIGYLIVE